MSPVKLILPASDVVYRVSVAAFNGVAWSDFGPTTKVRLLDHVPVAPAAPTLSRIEDDRVCVILTSAPAADDASTGYVTVPSITVVMRFPGGQVLYYNRSDHRLISPADANYNKEPCLLRSTSVHVQGLAPNTEYSVSVRAHNAFGFGPESPPTKFKTLPSEIEVAGVQTAQERDSEAMKRALDVDAADEPEKKRRTSSDLAVGTWVKRSENPIASQAGLLGKTGTIVGAKPSKPNFRLVDFGAPIGTQPVLKKHLDPV
jgi:hypothetical protein